MHTFTNMIWPDDPYGTGEQLYRQPPPQLAAFGVQWVHHDDEPLPVAAAVVYLRLHRTRAVPLDVADLRFGFRAVAITDPGEASRLVELVDLDLLQARRHAAVLAGHSFADDLYGLAVACDGTWRGVNAVNTVWQDRSAPQRGMAQMVDTAFDDKQADVDLRRVCLQLGIAPGTASAGLALTSVVTERWTSWEDTQAAQWLGVSAVERALVIALAAGRFAERCSWQGKIDIFGAVRTAAWDSFPSLLSKEDSDIKQQ